MNEPNTAEYQLSTARVTYRWRDFAELTKPKVTLSIVFTAIGGMVLASPRMVPLNVLALGGIGIGLASASAAALNHVLDRELDEKMDRTRRRPLPYRRIRAFDAVLFAISLGILSMLILVLSVGLLTAGLALCSLIGYAVVYTVWLKRRTPQNIVIGGAAGAFPPVIGWAAVTHGIEWHAWLLFLIIFMWTPPHFWSLAIARRADYAKAGVPMLPVTHGVAHTRLQIAIYTIILAGTTLLPYFTNMSGSIYLTAAIALNVVFLRCVYHLYRETYANQPMRTFRFSITYLLLLFSAMMVDHYLRA